MAPTACVSRRGPWPFAGGRIVARRSRIARGSSSRRGTEARLLPPTTRTPPVEFRAPLAGLHVYSPVQKELHPLALEESALRTGVANPEVRAAGSALLDDPVAGDTRPVGIVVHRPPHGAGRPWRPKHSRDLAVRGHLSPGNAGHQCVHAGEEAVSPPPLRGLAGLPPSPTLFSCRGHRPSSPGTPRPRAEAQPGAPGPRAIIQASHPKSRWRRLEPPRPPLAGVMTSKNALQTAGRHGSYTCLTVAHPGGPTSSEQHRGRSSVG